MEELFKCFNQFLIPKYCLLSRQLAWYCIFHSYIEDNVNAFIWWNITTNNITLEPITSLKSFFYYGVRSTYYVVCSIYDAMHGALSLSGSQTF